MKRRLKVLTLCLASLTLSGTVSGCAGNWLDVQNFLNGMYTTLDSWEGIKYEYTSEYTYKEEYTTSIGEVIKDKESSKSSISTTYKYKDGVTYMSSNSNYKNNNNGETSKSSTSSYSDDSGTYTKTMTNGSSEHRETTYESFNSKVYLSSQINSIENLLDTVVSRYGNANRNGSYFDVIGASVSNRSVSFTYNSGINTITIKTDSHYLVNYYCEEYYYESDSSNTSGSRNRQIKSYYKMVYKRIGGGKISKPSWINSYHFHEE